jgi:hypothetical protein
MQEEQSTKPYLYFENIINGITDIPKRIQSYLGHAILVRNEEQRIAMEQQKQNDTLSPPVTADSGGFKIPFLNWFAAKKDDAIVKEETHNEESPVKDDSVPMGESPVKDDSVPIGESPVKYDSVPMGESPVKDDSVPIGETPVKYDSVPMGESPVKDDSVPMGESPVKDDSVPIGETPVKDDSVPMGESPVKDDSLQMGEVSPLDKNDSGAIIASKLETKLLSKVCKVRDW